MPDSECRNQGQGFFEKSLCQFGRVVSRSMGDLKNVLYSENDLNTVTTTAAIVGAAFIAPTVFTVAGVLSVAGAALSEADGNPVTEDEVQHDAGACPDPAGA